jgi:cytochrome c5
MKTLKLLPLVLAIALSACGEKKSGYSAAQPEASAAVAAVASAPAASAPVAEAPAAAPAAPAASASAKATGSSDLVKGEQVYTTTCLACHGAGVLGAPKFGDKAAWAPRIAKGVDILHKNALNGLNLMPPKGGNAALSEDDLKAAVDYMVSKAS